MARVSIKKNFIDGEKLFAQQLNNNFKTIEEAVNDGNKIVWQDGIEVKFKRYFTNDIDSLPVLDGSIIYDTEKGRHYIDYKGQRVQVGSAGKEVLVQEEQPTEEDNKIWIESDIVNTMGTEISDDFSTSRLIGYSANYLNDKIIVESGSNDKGSYVKLGDGTLIQRGSFVLDSVSFSASGNIYSSDVMQIDYPIPFKSTNNDVNINCQAGGTHNWASSIISHAEYVKYNIMQTVSSSKKVYVRWSAVGTWK